MSDMSKARRVTIADGLRFGLLRPARRRVGSTVDQLTRARRMTIGDGFRFAVGFSLALGIWYLLLVVLVAAAFWHWLLFASILTAWIVICGVRRWSGRDENPKDRTVMGDELEPFDDDLGFDLFD